MLMSRRGLLRSVGASAGASLLPACTSLRWHGGLDRIPNIGLQLYTVRSLMETEPLQTLQKLAEIGYQEIEFSALGYYGYQPEQMRSALSDMGMTAPSRLVRLPHIKDQLNETLDQAEAAGHEHIVLAYLSEQERATLDHYLALVDLFHEVGAEAKRRGIQFSYHNHAFEFDAMEGVEPYDILLDRVDGELMKMTMDLYWFAKAGKDPIAYINKYPARFVQCHVKDMDGDGNMVDAGTGVVDFAGIFAQHGKAGLQHFYIEDRRQETPLQTADSAYEFLKTLRF